MITQMNAIQIAGYGNNDQLKAVKIAIPSIAADEVLVKVHAAAINPVDWKVREGYLQEMLPYPLPLTLGWDFAGEIVAKGAQVSDWEIGAAVYARPDIGRNGSYAEFIAVRASEIAHKPNSLNWQESAAVPLAALTAWQALYDFAELKAGEKVLIQAGAGGVGIMAIQLAKLRGAEVYTTCSSKNVAFLNELGADHVIDYTQQSLADCKGMDVVFDTLGGEALTQSFSCLKAGGRLVSIVDQVEPSTAQKHGVSASFCFVQPNRQQLDQLATLFDSNKMQVIIDSVFPLAEAKTALAKSETGRARGKIVLQVS